MATGKEEARASMAVGAHMTPLFKRQMHRLGGLKFAPQTLDTHWEALRDLGDDEFVAAVDRAQRECDEFPSPRQLRALAAPRWRHWHCPHVVRCDNRAKCRDATVLGRPEKAEPRDDLGSER